jgi:membrane protein DedA with SNARE-associated domain
MANLLVLFATVLLLNVMPAFAPPTWMVMSWIGLSRPDANPVLLAGVAACAATLGRLVLARLSCTLVRNRWMREADRQNIDVVRAWLEDRKGMTVGLMLAYAFSPFPSNYIFIAYGLTGMRLWLIGLPFFVGRWISYLTWTHIAQLGARYLDEETEIDGAYMGVYFIVSQVVFLALVYGFAKLDWRYFLQTKRLRWRRPESIASAAKDT